MEKIWLKNYHGTIPETIDPDQYQSLVDLLEESIQRHGDLPAFQHLNFQLTYNDVDRLSRDVAAYLQSHLGLQKGERIALMMPNLLQYPIMLIAALRAGLIVVNVNPLYKPDELVHQLNDADCNTIIVLSNFAQTVEKALPHTRLQNIIVTQFGDLFPAPKSWIINFVVKYVKKLVPRWKINNVIWFKKMISAGKHAKFVPAKIDREDVAFLQYTGGTTGRAKGAMLTHRNLIANVLQVEAFLAMPEGKQQNVVVTALPLYHVFCLLVNGLWHFHSGAMNLLISNPRDIKDTVRQLRGVPFTTIDGVNTLFNALLHDRDFRQLDFSHLSLSIGGGMAVQEKIANTWQRVTGCVLLQGYGLTETSPVVSCSPTASKRFDGSIGIPLSSTEISIRDDDDKELAIGESGELCVRGPQVMKGYWRQVEATAEVLSADGWLRTGDIATIDNDGFLRIVDRKKDMIIVSGFNVYPNEVEEVIMSHPGVFEAGVVGVPSEASGEAVKAYVILKDKTLEKQEIVKYCREHLTSYKIPHEIEFVKELPKSTVGKILRRALR